MGVLNKKLPDIRQYFRAESFSFVLVALAFAALVSLGGPEPFYSSEIRFSDLSSSGLAIVPASCPSNPHTAGECSPPTVTLTQTLSTTAQGQSFTVTYGRSGGGPATSCVLERYAPGESW